MLLTIMVTPDSSLKGPVLCIITELTGVAVDEVGDHNKDQQGHNAKT